MSVVVSKRTQSQFEVIYYVNTMRCEFETLLLRNFGLKNYDEIIRKRYNPTLDDEEKFEYINSRIIKEKEYISDLLRSVAHNITMANSIYATNYKYMSNKTKDNINDLYNELYIEPFLKGYINSVADDSIKYIKEVYA